MTSVCSGAFLLAAAGLLDGKRATTHWAECPALLAIDYHAVTVEPDAIYVHDRNVWTSAGVTAGIDLALALVAADHGRPQPPPPSPGITRRPTYDAPADKRSSRSPARRPTGRQRTRPAPISSPGFLITSPMTSPFSESSPNHAHLSERQFSGLFKSQIEVHHTSWSRRNHHGLRPPAGSSKPPDRATRCQFARTCGFRTPETMNRTFRRRLDTTPGEHRRHFRGHGVLDAADAARLLPDHSLRPLLDPRGEVCHRATRAPGRNMVDFYKRCGPEAGRTPPLPNLSEDRCMASVQLDSRRAARSVQERPRRRCSRLSCCASAA